MFVTRLDVEDGLVACSKGNPVVKGPRVLSGLDPSAASRQGCVSDPSVYCDEVPPPLSNSLLDGLVRELRVERVVGGAAREVGELVEVLLLLPDVPVAALGERGEPVGDLVLRAYRRHRVDRCGHAEAVRIGERSIIGRYSSPVLSLTHV